MTPELQKLLNAINSQDNIERLREVAIDLAKTVHLATNREMRDRSYRVTQRDGYELAEGTREYCLGYAGALDERTTGSYRVLCGEFQVWPEWGDPV